MNQLVLFAKHWTEGLVKTRLAARIGTRRAAQLAHLFLRLSLERWGELADQRWLAYAPRDQREAFLNLVSGTGWQIFPQDVGSLGHRLQRALHERWEAGAERLIFLGADTPLLPVDYLLQALDQLRSCEVVLGPATDGGYYLIGFARQRPELLEGIDWGTSQVFAQTLHILKSLDPPVRWSCLPEASDVDRWEDLLELWVELQHQTCRSSTQSELRELIETICQENGARLDGIESAVKEFRRPNSGGFGGMCELG